MEHCNYEEIAKKNDAITPEPVLYEKIDHLTQAIAVKSSHDEMSMSAPLPPPRLLDKVSMEDCQAYGVNKTTSTKNTTGLSSPSQQLSNIEMEECKAYGTSSQLFGDIEMEECRPYDMATRK